MASNNQVETVKHGLTKLDFSNGNTDSQMQEDGVEVEGDAGVPNLRSPQDKERRKKIINHWKCAGKKSGKRSLSLSTAAEIAMYSSSFQNTLDHFSNEETFDYHQGFTDQSTLFNFPQKPIEQEALRLEEIEIEQRANRKRKETIADTQSHDESKIACVDDLNFDLSRKFPPCFQRVNVGEEGASGVRNVCSLNLSVALAH